MFAAWPKGRLFGFESNPEGSFSMHLGRIERPSEILLNYEIVKPEGRVLAEVRADVDHGGRVICAFEDCVPLTQGSLGETLTWKSGAAIPAMPAAELHVRLENASVDAYEARETK